MPSSTPLPTPGRNHLWASLLALAGFIWLVLRLDAGSAAFDPVSQDMLSAGSAQLQHISKERHPMGSRAHAAVQTYLLEQIKALGYQPQLQNAFSLNPKGRYAAQIENVVVRIPGKQPGKALLLASHYDSVPNSHGAADDGISVVNMLQTMRHLKQGPMLENDVIFLFSDGEEAGLLGASAFTAHHPWMKDVAMVLNFDNRGNSGHPLMFETSDGNAQLIKQMAKAIPWVHSNSLLFEVYKAMPNGTDFTRFKQAGAAGLNFGLIENPASYHTAQDNPALLSRATMQEQAAIMLALTREFGNARLDQLAADNAIYFHIPGLGFLHYPAQLAPWLALLTVVLALLLLRRERQRQNLRLVRTLLAAPLFVLLLALTMALLHGLWQLVESFVPGFDTLREVDSAHQFLLACLLLAVLAIAGLQRLCLRWFTLAEQGFGGIWIWLLALAASSIMVPGVSFMLLWPLLAVLLCWLAIASIPRLQTPSAALWLGLAASVPGILLFVPMLRAFNIALGFGLLFVPLCLMLLLSGILTPLLGMLLRKAQVFAVLLVVLACCVAGASNNDSYAKLYPEIKQLIYAHKIDQAQAYWLSPNDEPPPETRKLFSGETRRQSINALFGNQPTLPDWPVWRASTQPWALINTSLVVNSDTVQDGQRHLVLQLQGAPQAAGMQLDVAGVSVQRSMLNQQLFTNEPKAHWHAKIEAVAATGVLLELQLPAGKPFTLHITDMYYSVPPGIANPVTQSNSFNFEAQVIQTREFK